MSTLSKKLSQSITELERICKKSEKRAEDCNSKLKFTESKITLIKNSIQRFRDENKAITRNVYDLLSSIEKTINQKNHLDL